MEINVFKQQQKTNVELSGRILQQLSIEQKLFIMYNNSTILLSSYMTVFTRC